MQSSTRFIQAAQRLKVSEVRLQIASRPGSIIGRNTRQDDSGPGDVLAIYHVEALQRLRRAGAAGRLMQVALERPATRRRQIV